MLFNHACVILVPCSRHRRGVSAIVRAFPQRSGQRLQAGDIASARRTRVALELCRQRVGCRTQHAAAPAASPCACDPHAPASFGYASARLGEIARVRVS